MDSPTSFEYNGNRYVELHFFHPQKHVEFFAILPLRLRVKRVNAFLRECGFLERDETIAELRGVDADMTLELYTFYRPAVELTVQSLNGDHPIALLADLRQGGPSPSSRSGVRHCIVHFSYSESPRRQGGALVPEDMTTYELDEFLRISDLFTDYEGFEILFETHSVRHDFRLIHCPFPSRLGDLRDECFGGKAIRIMTIESCDSSWDI